MRLSVRVVENSLIAYWIQHVPYPQLAERVAADDVAEVAPDAFVGTTRVVVETAGVVEAVGPVGLLPGVELVSTAEAYEFASNVPPLASVFAAVDAFEPSLDARFAAWLDFEVPPLESAFVAVDAFEPSRDARFAAWVDFEVPLQVACLDLTKQKRQKDSNWWYLDSTLLDATIHQYCQTTPSDRFLLRCYLKGQHWELLLYVEVLHCLSTSSHQKELSAESKQQFHSQRWDAYRHVQ